MITLDDFRKIELKVAKILEVTPHPSADRLYVLKVDLGLVEKKDEVTGEITSAPEIRELVAGIRLYYQPEELVGKQVIVLVNLQPATIRGIASNGMLLATKNGDQLAVLTLDRPIPEGSPVS